MNNLNTIIKKYHIALILRIIFSSVLVLLFLFVAIKKKEQPLLLTLYSSQIDIHFKSTNNSLDRPAYETELLQDRISTPSLKVQGADTFDFVIKTKNLDSLQTLFLEPIGSDRSEITISCPKDSIDVVSLIYDGSGTLKLSTSDSATSFQFILDSDSLFASKVYTELSIPEIFELKYDEHNFNLSAKNIGLTAIKQPYGGAQNLNITLANIDKHLRLEVKNKNIINKKIFRKINIQNFGVLGFDLREKEPVSTLKGGSLEYLFNIDTNKKHISEGSELEFKANELKINNIEIVNAMLRSEISGRFNKFKIRKLGDQQDMLPSLLNYYADKWLPYSSITLPGFLAIYIFLIIRIAFGEKAAKTVADFIKMARGK